jgi:hypothetical protein
VTCFSRKGKGRRARERRTKRSDLRIQQTSCPKDPKGRKEKKKNNHSNICLSCLDPKRFPFVGVFVELTSISTHCNPDRTYCCTWVEKISSEHYR